MVLAIGFGVVELDHIERLRRIRSVFWTAALTVLHGNPTLLAAPVHAVCAGAQVMHRQQQQ